MFRKPYVIICNYMCYNYYKLRLFKFQNHFTNSNLQVDYFIWAPQFRSNLSCILASQFLSATPLSRYIMPMQLIVGYNQTA